MYPVQAEEAVRAVLENPVESWGTLRRNRERNGYTKVYGVRELSLWMDRRGCRSESENPRVYRGRLDTAENVTSGR